MDQSLDEYHSANDDSFVHVPAVPPNAISSLATATANTTPATTNTTPATTTSPTTVAPTTTATTTPGARKQLTPTDPNEPVKPLSSYALFFRDTVSAIKQQNPNCSFQELSRIVASMWEGLDPTHKNVYNKKNELARIEYLKELRAYKEQQQQQIRNEMTANNNLLQTKPAVFTIGRANAEKEGGAVVNSNLISSPIDQNSSHQQQQLNTNNLAAPASSATTVSDPPPPQMLAEDIVQKCTRENCNQRAIVNPDWEDEYCSNECVVIHCRNVFNAWVQSNLGMRSQ